MITPGREERFNAACKQGTTAGAAHFLSKWDAAKVCVKGVWLFYGSGFQPS